MLRGGPWRTNPAQVRGHDGRQSGFDRLEAAVDFALDRRALAGDVDFRSEGRLRPAEECGEHLPRLVRIVVDRLLAHDDELRLLLRDDRLEELRDRERLKLGVDVQPRIATLKVVEPPKRKGGGKVADVAELVTKLRNESKVI